MHALHQISTRPSQWSAPAIAVCLTLAMLIASGDARAQRAFDDADDAIGALVGAIAANDRAAMLEILGTQYEDRLVTADWGAEKTAREQIATTAKQKTRAVAVEDGRVEWLFGEEEWPFPFDAVRAPDGKWRFDTEAGIEAVIDRRVGRNELTAIAIVNAYVDAQIE